MLAAPTKLIYQSSKTYTHSQGLSCCFRQWKANSHCQFLHGYALRVEVVFQAELDERNWVQDFGGLKSFKAWLEKTFDHKTLIAHDDPMSAAFNGLENAGVIQITRVEAVGCEKFAELICRWLQAEGYPVLSVQVWEHEGNSAKVIVTEDNSDIIQQLEQINKDLELTHV